MAREKEIQGNSLDRPLLAQNRRQEEVGFEDDDVMRIPKAWHPDLGARRRG